MNQFNFSADLIFLNRRASLLLVTMGGLGLYDTRQANASVHEDRTVTMGGRP